MHHVCTHIYPSSRSQNVDQGVIYLSTIDASPEVNGQVVTISPRTVYVYGRSGPHLRGNNVHTRIDTPCEARRDSNTAGPSLRDASVISSPRRGLFLQMADSRGICAKSLTKTPRRSNKSQWRIRRVACVILRNANSVNIICGYFPTTAVTIEIAAARGETRVTQGTMHIFRARRLRSALEVAEIALRLTCSRERRDYSRRLVTSRGLVALK